MRESQAHLKDLKREFGLEDPIPYRPDAPAGNLATLLSQWLCEVAFDEGGRRLTIERDLAAARQEFTV